MSIGLSSGIHLGRVRRGGAAAVTLPTGSLVAEYRVDTGSGQQLTDSSGNARHGTLGSTAGVDTDDPTWVAGGLSFDGVNDNVPATIAAANFSTNARTTLLAFTARTGAFSHAIFANDAFGIGITGGTMLMTHYGVIDMSLGSATFNTPMFVAATYNGTTMRAKLNSGTWTTSTSACNTPVQSMRLGGTSLAGDSPYDGVVHYAVHYSRVLSDPEVITAYQAIKTRLASRGVTLP